MATKAEANAVYAAGLIQGIALVRVRRDRRGDHGRAELHARPQELAQGRGPRAHVV